MLRRLNLSVFGNEKGVFLKRLNDWRSCVSVVIDFGGRIQEKENWD